ncbi:hypothetical protein [Dokdonella ginsengisoli]|uniref:Uncharacterized protein n=1 Tax=Dokdonella ginsengisoli TaxID=363846 RepID=A0ABV9R221_9GAMM
MAAGSRQGARGGATAPLRRIAVCAAIGALAAARAGAEGWSGSLGLASNNLYRGLSLTLDRPAWIADLRYEIGDEWLIGLGASAERPEYESPAAQIALRIDRRWQLGENWAAKVGYAHYEEPWNFWRNELRYDEVNVALGWRGRWSLSLAATPNRKAVYAYTVPQREGFAAWTEATFRQPIAGRLAADFGFGYAYLARSGDRNYRYGSAGLSYGIGDVELYFARVWTDGATPHYWWEDADRRRPAHSRWLVSAMWNF